MFFKICASAGLIGISSSTFADNKFNQNLQKIIECKKSMQDFVNLGWNFKKDLAKNHWSEVKSQISFFERYRTNIPFHAFGFEVKEILFYSGGFFAVLPDLDAKQLAIHYQIEQYPYIKDPKFFSGGKVLQVDPETKELEQSVRVLKIAEADPETEKRAQTTYIGCSFDYEYSYKAMQEILNESSGSK